MGREELHDLEVTTYDPNTGEREVAYVPHDEGGWLLVCGQGCEVTYFKEWDNGTVQLVVKPSPKEEPSHG